MRTVAELKEAGHNPYPHKFPVDMSIPEFRERFDHLKPNVCFAF